MSWTQPLSLKGLGSQFRTLRVNWPRGERRLSLSGLCQVPSAAPWPGSAAQSLSLLPSPLFSPLGWPPATVLKPDEGTADLPAGRVRLCIDADKTVTEVDEERVHRVSPCPLPACSALSRSSGWRFPCTDCRHYFGLMPWRIKPLNLLLCWRYIARGSLLCPTVSPFMKTR